MKIDMDQARRDYLTNMFIGTAIMGYSKASREMCEFDPSNNTEDAIRALEEWRGSNTENEYQIESPRLNRDSDHMCELYIGKRTQAGFGKSLREAVCSALFIIAFEKTKTANAIGTDTIYLFRALTFQDDIN